MSGFASCLGCLPTTTENHNRQPNLTEHKVPGRFTKRGCQAVRCTDVVRAPPLASLYRKSAPMLKKVTFCVGPLAGLGITKNTDTPMPRLMSGVEGMANVAAGLLPVRK